MEDIYKEMEYRINRINEKGCPSRTYHFKIALDLYLTNEEIQKLYSYFPEAFYMKDRLIKKSKIEEANIHLLEQIVHLNNYETEEMEMPQVNGLYLLGQTSVNPFTKEEIYWVKVGMSSDVKRRVNQYTTYNPMFWQIQYIELDEDITFMTEQLCHKDLLQNKIGSTLKRGSEWVMVPKDIYLEICNKGFSWFPTIKSYFEAYTD